MMYAWLYWDPNRFIFTVPLIDRPIAWYGFFFVIGFIIGYFIMTKMLRITLRHTQYVAERDIQDWSLLIKPFTSGPSPDLPKQKTVLSYFSEKAKIAIKKLELGKTPSRDDRTMIIEGINEAISDPNNSITRENIDTCFPNAIYSLKDLAMYLTDRLTWFIIGGTLIGARLGHVFFYDWARYQKHPIDILKIWEGGLASHGGAIGVIIAIVLYLWFIRKRFPEIKFLALLDNVVVPTALVGCFIRIGNFFNQEIIGTETDLPWAVVFGHPYDGSGIFPRHPAQLYESVCYLITFFVLGWLWINKREILKTGYLTGLFFVMIFTSRFIVEFVKVPQGGIVDDSFLQTGQVLSIPFIFVGLWLMFRPKLSMRS
jgi:phosphatidylglycerol---prolipoprotein diacylglyceryl transferase